MCGTATGRTRSCTSPTPPADGCPEPATPGAVTEPGLIVYRFGADLFYANQHRFCDEVRKLVAHAPGPLRYFVVDASAITDIDYSAARSLRALIEDLQSNGVRMMFGRVTHIYARTWTGTGSPR